MSGENLKTTLAMVLKQYPVKVKKVTNENYKGKKGVWFVDTEKTKVVLKKMPVSPERLQFLLAATDHLKQGGVNFPQLIKNKAGNPYTQYAGSTYCLFEAINGKTPDYENLKDLQAIMRSLATFHKASTGFSPPNGVKISNQLGTWTTKYTKQISQLTEFKHKVNAKAERNAFDKRFLTEVDEFIKLGNEALRALKSSDYSKWVNRVSKSHQLCHQDYAAGNLSLTTSNKLFVFDIDGLTIELPAQDIRKILNKVMKKQASWDLDQAVKMLKWYHAVHPLTKAEYRVLFIDMSFPHLFHGIVSKYYLSRDRNWDERKYMERLESMIRAEKTKSIVTSRFDEIYSRIIRR